MVISSLSYATLFIHGTGFHDEKDAYKFKSYLIERLITWLLVDGKKPWPIFCQFIRIPILLVLLATAGKMATVLERLRKISTTPFKRPSPVAWWQMTAMWKQDINRYLLVPGWGNHKQLDQAKLYRIPWSPARNCPHLTRNASQTAGLFWLWFIRNENHDVGLLWSWFRTISNRGLSFESSK